jgi:hypothetical protein
MSKNKLERIRLRMSKDQFQIVSALREGFELALRPTGIAILGRVYTIYRFKRKVIRELENWELIEGTGTWISTLKGHEYVLTDAGAKLYDSLEQKS